MVLDDPSFWQAVEALRKLALEGTALAELLESAKARAGKRNTVLAIAIFYRAFDLPLGVATSLGSWTGFEAEFGRDGRTAEDLEAEYGELIRVHARRRLAPFR